MSGGRTWWGIRFMETLADFTDSGRLQCGRSYSSDNRILPCHIENGVVSATVRGKINPYFNVYKEPKCAITIRMTPLPDKTWNSAIRTIGTKAALAAPLPINEMPENIETALNQGRALLPRNRRDFSETSCSCPDDWGESCKHMVGVYYRLAQMIDQEPLLLFELRGMPRDRLISALAKTPLGKALAEAPDETDQEINVEPYFIELAPAPQAQLSYTDFWRGAKALPAEDTPLSAAPTPAMLTKKGGPYPPFWHKEHVLHRIHGRILCSC